MHNIIFVINHWCVVRIKCNHSYNINNNSNNDIVKEEEKVQFEDIPEEVPSRSNKNSHTEEKEDKVDADFFELIDSMYKERSDE